LWPFFYGTWVTLFWTIIGICLPGFVNDFYKLFSNIPVLIYPEAFYGGDSYNATAAENHPFLQLYKQGSIFFNNVAFVETSLIIVLIIQVIFLIVVTQSYVVIWKNEKKENIKEL
jgi:hypothetical protein